MRLALAALVVALGAPLGCGPAAKPVVKLPISKPIEVTKEKSGTLLEHVPKACGMGRLYFSARTALADPALHASIFSFRDRIIATAGKGDWLEIVKIHSLMKDSGIDPIADLHAIALCMPKGSSRDPVVVIEGNFEGRDVLSILLHSADHIGEKYELNGNGPTAYLESKYGGCFSMVSPNVLVWAGKRSAIEAVRPPIDRSADWAIAPDDVLVGELVGDEYTPRVVGRLRIEQATLRLAMTVGLKKHDLAEAQADPQKYELKLHKELDQFLDRLAKGPLAPVVPSIRKVTIALQGPNIVIDGTMPTSSFAAALDGLDANNFDTIF